MTIGRLAKRQGFCAYSAPKLATMKNFPDGVFSPEQIAVMTAALERSIESLPEPVSASHVQLLAESILRTANAGERDVAVLSRIALVELQITPRG